ncbi:shikimate dehydrogenase [Mycoplasmatota bacterium]|nr:shikimate dehydrogenase [Mycoplasmatota bacterium]
MKSYAVVGQNINYSMSPILHQHHFSTLNIDASYKLLTVDNLDVEELKKLSGFNVTIPYKEEMALICEELSESAKNTKAVNCVKVVNNRFFGFNTDVSGFYMLLIKHQLIKPNQNVLIIGAGGAAKAVFYCFKENTNCHLFMTNRTKNRAYEITDQVIDIRDISKELERFDIVVNCTNVGVKSYESPIEMIKIKENACFIDINYQSKSLFLDMAKKLNAKTINGLDMLIYQAAKSFEIWFNQKANVEAMYQSLERI